MSTAIVVAVISGVVSLAAAAISLVSARSVARLNSEFRSSGSSAAASAKAPVGGYRIRARYSTATAQDAAWDTFDRSDGTFTRVTRGRVVVQDLNHDRRVVLRGGGRHLARP